MVEAPSCVGAHLTYEHYWVLHALSLQNCPVLCFQVTPQSLYEASSIHRLQLPVHHPDMHTPSGEAKAKAKGLPADLLCNLALQ